MKSFRMAATLGITIYLASCTLLAADKPNVVGWRGDATGAYPQATGPIEWGCVSKNIAGVTAQAKKPGAGVSGQSLEDGAIHEWLVLGPVTLPAGATAAAELLPGEAKFSPDENQKVGDLTWKLVKTDSSYVNFPEIFANAAKSGAYAHTYIYSPNGLALVGRQMQHGGIKVWLNGKEVGTWERPWSSNVDLKVNKGWNSLLVKVVPDAEGWYTSLSVYGGAPWVGENKNIAWTCKTPNKGNASPIIVGDKIFVTSDPYDLCCVNRADGKILWVRTNNYFETLTKEEKQKLPEVAPLATRLNEINAMWGTATPPDGKLIQEKRQLENKINDAMRKFDPAKYKMVDGQDAGYAGMTPVSDGKNVWAWYATGVSVCYDLAGNRQWMFLANGSIPEHGFASSPTLAGDKFVVHMAETIALDAQTGKVAWRMPDNNFYGSLQTFYLNGEALLLDPSLLIVRAKDGKVLYKPKNWSRTGGCGQMATPVVQDGMIYVLGGPSATVYKLPATAAEPFNLQLVKSVAFDTKSCPKFFGEWYTSSPAVHDGLFYGINNDGMLSVVDTKAGKVVYTKLADVNVCYNHNMKAARGVGASIAIAGKYVYIFGNQNTAAVLEAGPTFKQVAKNRIENYVDANEWFAHQESSVASPVFEGNKLYYRAEDNLYCIGAAK
jgi:outer membrane protein assembly factor BamB